MPVSAQTEWKATNAAPSDLRLIQRRAVCYEEDVDVTGGHPSDLLRKGTCRYFLRVLGALHAVAHRSFARLHVPEVAAQLPNAFPALRLMITA